MTLLSIDLGTTACKAAVCTADGQFLGTGYIEYPLIRPRPNVVEQDADLWWSLSQRAVQQALADAGTPGHEVAAVGISTQGISFVPVDRMGRVLRNAICWLDTRAEQEVALVRERIADDQLFQATGKRTNACYVLPKLLWLRRHEPQTYARTSKFLMAHDLLLSRLCGMALTDYSMAGGTLLLDLQRLDWSEELLAEFDLDRAKLPDLVHAGSIAGTLSPELARALSLRPETPVVVGGQDQKCAALGAGIRPGVATVSLGTATAVSCLSQQPVLDPMQRIPVFPFVRPGLWDLEGVVGTSGAALKWVRDTFFPAVDYPELVDLAQQSPPGARGACFFPHLTGATSPLWQSEARGAFAGLNLSAGAGDVVRSVLEGVAFQIRSNVTVMETMAPIDELVLFGGGAKSPLWADIICQVTGKPVSVTHVVDVANWGACLLAGIGAGLYQADKITKLPQQRSARINPIPESVDRYDELYQAYQETEGRLLRE